MSDNPDKPGPGSGYGYGLPTPGLTAKSFTFNTTSPSVNPNKYPEVTDKEKKNAILKKYCDIIDGQKDKIITSFNEGFDKFITHVFEEQNGTELSKFIEDIIFLQMKKSILDNYYVQNSFVVDILNIEKIKNILRSAYYNKPDKNKIFKTFVTKLKEHLKKPEVPVSIVDVNDINVGIKGGDPTDDIVKLMKWFPQQPDYNTSQEMVYLVKNKIAKYLNDDRVKKAVIYNIIKKLNTYISNSSDNFINGLSEHLKIRILYALLTSKTDRRVHRKFKGALDEAENNGGFENFESFMDTIITHFGQRSNTRVGGKSQGRKQKKTKKRISRKNKRTNKKTHKKTRH